MTSLISEAKNYERYESSFLKHEIDRLSEPLLKSEGAYSAENMEDNRLQEAQQLYLGKALPYLKRCMENHQKILKSMKELEKFLKVHENRPRVGTRIKRLQKALQNSFAHELVAESFIDEKSKELSKILEDDALYLQEKQKDITEIEKLQGADINILKEKAQSFIEEIENDTRYNSSFVRQAVEAVKRSLKELNDNSGARKAQEWLRQDLINLREKMHRRREANVHAGELAESAAPYIDHPDYADKIEALRRMFAKDVDRGEISDETLARYKRSLGDILKSAV